jgi:hypothetical protein
MAEIIGSSWISFRETFRVYDPLREMRALVLRAVRWVAGAVVVISVCWNFWDVTHSFAGLWPREADDLVITENRFAPIRFALWDQGYTRGDVDYATASVLSGKAATGQEKSHWAQIRYAAIPFNLVDGNRTAPYLVGDFADGEPILEAPAGLIRIYDHGDGLVLYKRKVSP